MITILSSILTVLARLTLWRYRPQIVAVTGNAGKTTTKEAIAAVLRSRYRVRATGGNLNNELGTPATILGDFSSTYYATGGTARFWLTVLVRGLMGLCWQRDYPEILVLEYGADAPGDIARMVRRFPPHVGVVTHVGDIPVHVEFFASAKHLAQEKMQIVRHLPTTGRAILNYDDLTVLEMREHTAAPVTTFGFGQGADVAVSDVQIYPAAGRPQGIRFTLSRDRHAMPIAVPGTLGRGVASACAAASAVGAVYQIGLADAAQQLAGLKVPPGRMRILAGIKDTVIIDDTYNASPSAVHLALDTVRQVSGRKILVLGDMLELGQHSMQAHRSIGDMAGDLAAKLVCVGERARLIADSAANQMLKEHIHWFHNSLDARATVQELVRPGDVVLVKGSQGMRMERIVQEIMAEPHRASELLVRQSTRWLQK